MTSRVRVLLAAGGFVILAASAFLAIRVGARETTPITLAGMRFLSASAGFAALALLGHGFIRTDFRRRHLPLFLLTGLTGSVLYSLALIKGQQTASAGTASLIVATIPIWATVMAVSLGREKLQAGAWIGVGMGFMGTLVITVDPSGLGRFDTGAAFVLVAALSNAVYFVAVRTLVIEYGALSAVAGTVWMGTLLFVPMIFWMEPPTAWSLAAATSGLFLGLCATLAGASLFAFVIGRVGSARASTVTYLVAPMVVLFEWIIFADPPGSNLVLGGMLTLTGLFLVRPRYKRESEMAYAKHVDKSTMNPTSVRSAHASDVPALVALAKELAQYQDLGDRFAATEAGIRAGLFGRHRSAEALVAEQSGVVVGYAIIARSFSSTAGAPKLIVEDMFVSAERRGCGVGRTMFKAIAQRAYDLDACKIEWTVLRDNHDAMAFYQGLGAGPAPEWMTCAMEGIAIEDLCSTESARKKGRPAPPKSQRMTGDAANLAECG